MRDKAIEKILRIAKKLNKDGYVMTRSQLAYNLKDLDYGKDSIELNKLAWEAWKHYGDNAIVKAFINNDGTGSLVDEYQIHFLMEDNSIDDAFVFVSKTMKRSGKALTDLSREIKESSKTYIADGASLMERLSGTAETNLIRKEAASLYNGMAELVDSYSIAKDEIKESAAIFLEVREGVNSVFQKYLMLLHDLYGERIKSIEPELFDFDSIEWLDVKGMFETIKLEFDTLSTSCSRVIGEIQENFSNTLKTASDAYRAGGDNMSRLMLAGLALANHYISSGSQNLELRQDLIKMKKHIRKDVSVIQADHFRLNNIFRTINELLIPKAEAFFRYSNDILSDKTERLSEIFYSNPSIQDLALQRKEILDELRTIERELHDQTMSIAYFEQVIEEQKTLLTSMRPEYETARRNKPDKPIFLLNILTFGAAGKSYNRDVYDWTNSCGPLINEYECTAAEHQVFLEDIKNLKQESRKLESRHKALRLKVSKLTSKISEAIKGHEDIQAEMLPYVKDIIGLLRVAKEILSSGLDEQVIRPVKVKDVKFDVPAETIENIRTFTDCIRTVCIETDMDGEDAAIVMSNNEVYEKAAEYMKQWEIYEELQKTDDAEAAHYAAELESIRRQFRKGLDKIQDKGDVLRKTLSKINTTLDSETIKDGLLSLYEGTGVEFTDDDLMEFIKGNKTILI